MAALFKDNFFKDQFPTQALYETLKTFTDYEWPIAALECSEKTLHFNSSRNSLIFPARMNNLSTVMEYELD